MKCNNNHLRRVLSGIGAALLLAIFLYAASQIVSYLRAENENRQLSEDLIEKAVHTPPPSSQAPDSSEPQSPETVPIEVDFETLWQENEDIVAWLYCENTPIHYPIVQGNDNNYYLRRLLNGEYNINGTIFLDYRCQSDFRDFNSIIYGHHMKSGEMFGTLPNYKDQEYYDEHPVMYLLTPEQNYKIELVAGYITPSDSDTYSLPNTAEEKKAFLEHALQESTFVSSVSVNETDSFVSLSTCSYEYENARYVVVGRLVMLG